MMEFRVTLTLQAPPGGTLPADPEQATEMLDGLLTQLLRVEPSSGAVVDGCAGESTLTVTLGLDAPDAALAVQGATEVLGRVLGGPPATAWLSSIIAETVAVEPERIAV